jgi:hypothetical protein
LGHQHDDEEVDAVDVEVEGQAVEDGEQAGPYLATKYPFKEERRQLECRAEISAQFF